MPELDEDWHVMPEDEADRDFAAGVVKLVAEPWFGCRTMSAARFREWRERYYARLATLSGLRSTARK